MKEFLKKVGFLCLTACLLAGGLIFPNNASADSAWIRTEGGPGWPLGQQDAAGNIWSMANYNDVAKNGSIVTFSGRQINARKIMIDYNNNLLVAGTDKAISTKIYLFKCAGADNNNCIEISQPPGFIINTVSISRRGDIVGATGSNKISKYDAVTQTWTTLPDLPVVSYYPFMYVSTTGIDNTGTKIVVGVERKTKDDYYQDKNGDFYLFDGGGNWKNLNVSSSASYSSSLVLGPVIVDYTNGIHFVSRNFVYTLDPVSNYPNIDFYVGSNQNGWQIFDIGLGNTFVTGSDFYRRWDYKYLTPLPPKGVRANVNSASDKVNIMWNAQYMAQGYKVYRNGILLGTTTVTNFQDNGVEPGQTYNYSITTTNPGGESAGEHLNFYVPKPEVTRTLEAAEAAKAAAEAAKAAAQSVAGDISYIKNTQLVNIEGSLRDSSGNTIISITKNIQSALNSGGSIYSALRDGKGTTLEAARDAVEAAKKAEDAAKQGEKNIKDTITEGNKNLNDKIDNIQTLLPPTLTKVSGYNRATATSSTTFNVSLDFSNASEFRYQVDGGAWSSWTSLASYNASGYFSINVSSAGAHTVNVQLRNKADGATATGSMTFFKL